jgi:glycosyltransferase involved in cell wall biosynthesis
MDLKNIKLNLEKGGTKGKVHKIVIISVNDTRNPKTGGEYVYKVMKDELIRNNYVIKEVSVPFVLERFFGKRRVKQRSEDAFRIILHMKCVIDSLIYRNNSQYIVITSSHPAFPVFGHLVYHQPKAGIGAIDLSDINIYRKIGWKIVENDRLSPIWLFSKRSHVIHLSNSFFTKKLVKKLYNIDSTVLYPPVNIPWKSVENDINKRVFGVIIAKPDVVSGITRLPELLEYLPRKIKVLIIGRADDVGLRIIKGLKGKGYNIEYLGYVADDYKFKLFNTFSYYVNLAINETFGITIVEAMSCGCIPLAHKSGAIPEYLPEELTYLELSEAAKKIEERVGLKEIDFRVRLKKITEQFREEKFRLKFMSYVKELEDIV